MPCHSLHQLDAAHWHGRIVLRRKEGEKGREGKGRDGMENSSAEDDEADCLCNGTIPIL